MKTNEKHFIAFFIGIVIILISIGLFIERNPYWFYPAPIGVWLFFDFLSYKIGNKTTLSLIFSGNYKKFIVLYIYLLIFGYLIELIGMITFNLWSYKYLNYTPTFLSAIKSIHQEPLILLGQFIYPFILMSFKEMYYFVYSFMRNNVISTIITTIISIIIWEVPNNYSRDWIYNIPLIKLEILNINIVVIIGWVILIRAPLLIYRRLKIK